MKFIKSTIDFINFLIDKGEAGYYSPQELTDVTNVVILEMFSEFLSEYPSTQLVERYMDAFKRDFPFTTTNGTVNINNLDWQKQRFCVTDKDVKFSILTPDEFFERANSSALPPSEAYPLCCIENGKLLIRPKQISATFYYITKPKDVKYAFTQVNGRYVYDDANSIDIEFPRSIHPRIQSRVLEKLGINVRENLFIEYSNLQQQKEPK